MCHQLNYYTYTVKYIQKLNKCKSHMYYYTNSVREATELKTLLNLYVCCTEDEMS